MYNTRGLSMYNFPSIFNIIELMIHHLKYMASSHANVKKGTPHVLLMASPHNTSEGVF